MARHLQLSALLPPNEFEATIRDSGGIVTGVTRQPGEFFEPEGIVKHAVIEGSREGSSLTFQAVRRSQSPDAPLSRNDPAGRRRGGGRMDDTGRLVGHVPDGTRAGTGSGG
jgi:hypothetical protein